MLSAIGLFPLPAQTCIATPESARTADAGSLSTKGVGRWTFSCIGTSTGSSTITLTALRIAFPEIEVVEPIRAGDIVDTRQRKSKKAVVAKLAARGAGIAGAAMGGGLIKATVRIAGWIAFGIDEVHQQADIWNSEVASTQPFSGTLCDQPATLGPYPAEYRCTVYSSLLPRSSIHTYTRTLSLAGSVSPPMTHPVQEAGGGGDGQPTSTRQNDRGGVASSDLNPPAMVGSNPIRQQYQPIPWIEKETMGL